MGRAAKQQQMQHTGHQVCPHCPAQSVLLLNFHVPSVPCHVNAWTVVPVLFASVLCSDQRRLARLARRAAANSPSLPVPNSSFLASVPVPPPSHSCCVAAPGCGCACYSHLYCLGLFCCIPPWFCARSMPFTFAHSLLRCARHATAHRRFCVDVGVGRRILRPFIAGWLLLPCRAACAQACLVSRTLV